MSEYLDNEETDPMHAVAEMDPVTEMAARFDAMPEWQEVFKAIDRRDQVMLEKLAREAKARADAATEGPWLHYESTRLDDRRACGYDSREHHRGAPYYCTGPRVDSDAQASTDARFIAHARTDVPALADAVLRLLEENRRLKATLRGHGGNVDPWFGVAVPNFVDTMPKFYVGYADYDPGFRVREPYRGILAGAPRVVGPALTEDEEPSAGDVEAAR